LVPSVVDFEEDIVTEGPKPITEAAVTTRSSGQRRPVVSVALGCILGALAGIILGMLVGIGIAMLVGVL
jgi:hypothetical protein